MTQLNSYRTGPDSEGRFGIYGGRFVAETLMPLILQVQQAYEDAKADPSFQAEIDYYAKHYVGRPSSLYYAERWSKELGGAQIYLKREDLQTVRSYKIRGAYNKMSSLTREELQIGVVCASAGNHAQT